MVNLETTVDNGDGDVLRSGHARFPGREKVDVGTSLRSVDVSVVVIMPLVGQQRVVKRHCGCRSLRPRNGRWRHRQVVLVIRNTVDRYALCILYAERRTIKVTSLRRCHRLIVVGDVIPEVEAERLVFFLVFTRIWEDALHAHCTKLRRRDVELLDTRLYIACTCLELTVGRELCGFHE